LKSERKGKDDDDELDDEPDAGAVRILECMKSNYSALAGAKRLTWQNGLLMPVSTMPSVQNEALEHKAREIFLTILRRFQKNGRPASAKLQSNNYAPKIFAGEPEAKELHRSKGIRKQLFKDAMTHLFYVNQIYESKPAGQRYESLYEMGPLFDHH
jgi:hypothetical protein